MVKKYFYTVMFILFYAVIFSRFTLAADVNIVTSPHAGVYDVILSLNKNESINAVQGSILFDENSMVLPSIETKESIIALWTEKPAVFVNVINFSGIIPGGFSLLYDQFGGKPAAAGKLFSIAVPFNKKFNSYTFTFDSVSLYRNDGQATEIKIPYKSFTVPASIDKNDFSSNTIFTPLPFLGNSSNAQFIFLILLVLFLIVFYYLIKRARPPYA